MEDLYTPDTDRKQHAQNIWGEKEEEKIKCFQIE